MRTVTSMLEAVKSIDLDMLERRAMENAAAEYVDLQKDQLADGLRSDNRPIFNLKTGKDTYSPAYAIYKGFSRPINLKDKQNFYNGVFARMGPDGLIVDSTDSKANMLQERYGDEIFGLNSGRKPEWLDTVKETFYTDLHNAL